jgi:hypothetical protein
MTRDITRWLEAAEKDESTHGFASAIRSGCFDCRMERSRNGTHHELLQRVKSRYATMSAATTAF